MSVEQEWAVLSLRALLSGSGSSVTTDDGCFGAMLFGVFGRICGRYFEWLKISLFIILALRNRSVLIQPLLTTFYRFQLISNSLQ